jgi:hypothetical protein
LMLFTGIIQRRIFQATMFFSRLVYKQDYSIIITTFKIDALLTADY